MAAPAHRTERLLNLVICLLSTRSWLTKEQIRAAVPQYAECATSEAFDRMFERDKEDLRELGIPIVTGTHSAWFEDEQGYRIDRGAYARPGSGSGRPWPPRGPGPSSSSRRSASRRTTSRLSGSSRGSGPPSPPSS